VLASPTGDTPAAKRNRIPRHYQRVEIQYSRLGVEDFDFGSVPLPLQHTPFPRLCYCVQQGSCGTGPLCLLLALPCQPALYVCISDRRGGAAGASWGTPRFYNRTVFSGLETHLHNSYCNAFLQLLYYLPPVRALVLAHSPTAHDRDACLSCELNFLFRTGAPYHGGRTVCPLTRKAEGVRTHRHARWLGRVPLPRTQLFGRVWADPPRCPCGHARVCVRASLTLRLSLSLSVCVHLPSGGPGPGRA
jgi:hypothetical protein